MGATATQSLANRPNGAMFLDADQLNLVNGVSTKVLVNVICADFVDGIEDLGNNRIEPLRPGFYLCIAQVTFTDVVADKLYELKMKLGPKTIRDFKHSRTTDDLTLRCVDVMYCMEAVERFDMWATQNSGGNTVDVKGGIETQGYTFLTIQRVR